MSDPEVTDSGEAVWRQRFTAVTTGFPAWSPARPELLFHLTDASGSTQGWVLDARSGARTRLTDQPVGVEQLVVLPDGSGAAWWSDATGDEYGTWVVTDVRDLGGALTTSATTRPLVADLPPGWSQGLSLEAGTVAVALADDDTYRILVGQPGEQLSTVHESSRPAGIGRVWEQTAGGLSADGSLLCYRHSERGDILHFALRVVRTDASAKVVGDLHDAGLTLAVAAWSPVPGDQRLALVHERDGIERPAVWDLTTGARRDYPLDLPGPVDVAGWWPDGDALLLVHQHLGRAQLYRLEVDSGAVSLVHDPQGWISGAAVRPDGEVWLREESATRAPVVRSVGGAVVLAAEPDGRAAPLPPPGRPHESLTFDGPGGTTHLLLTRPGGAAASAPYPAVLLVHGGPEWAYPDDFDPWEQALVEHGYAIVKVNYRGSTGSTVGWRTALHGGNIGFPEVADVVAGLDHLVSAGIVDPARVAIEGWSWGGYVTLLAAGLHPDRFAAAVAGIPVCDSVLTHEDCSPPQRAYDLAIMGGSPDELPALYAERSPITYVDRVRAPVLIIAGEHDSACPVRQVRHYVQELRGRGGEVEAHIYPAGHHTSSIAERLAHAELTLDFLARNVPASDQPTSDQEPPS